LKPAARISAVIPTYNASARLRRTITAVLGQTEPPHEIIVIDDGSSDDTPAVCAGFADRIRYHRVPNGGQQRARNLGAEMASGDWIALLDHDDLWHPGYIAELMAFHATHDVDVTICDGQDARDTGSGLEVTRASRLTDRAPDGYWRAMGADPAARWSVLERYDFAAFLAFHPCQPSVMSISREFYQKSGGFDPRMRGSNAENFEFELRVLRTARVGMLWTPLVSIVNHDANASLDGGKMAMDLVECLMFVKETGSLGLEDSLALEREMQRRLPDAIAGAFLVRRFDAIARYRRRLRDTPDVRTRIKTWIAALPDGLARAMAAVLIRGAASR